VEVPITLTTNGLDPSVFDFGFAYDGTKLDFVQVEAGTVVTNAGKQIGFSEGTNTVNFVVWGLNATVMGNGHLMTVTFRILSAATVGDQLAVSENGTASAANPDEESLAVSVVPGTLSVTQDSRTCLLTILVDGDGSTDPAPGVYQIPEGDSVDIEALSTSGARFSGWQGDLSGSKNPATIVMDEDKVVTAVFGCRGLGFKEGVQPTDAASAGSLGIILLACWVGTRHRRSR